MRSRYKFIEEDGIYFVTSTITEWIPVFVSESYFQIIIDSLEFCREKKKMKLHAYVIMENHVHLIVSGENLSDTLKSFKMFTATEIIKQLKFAKKEWLLHQFEFYKKRTKKESIYQVWQEGLHPQLVNEEDIFIQKVEYIHENPVRRGYVIQPEYWKYSSAGYYITGEKGVMGIDDPFENNL
ncbi:MAG: transposase [Candidatus Cloacimonetes bacterium]|nr:transposase [Candidatus Cloacimonadota bacterium]